MDTKKIALTLVVFAFIGCGGGEDAFTFPARDTVCADPTATPCMTTVPGMAPEILTVEAPTTMPDTTLTYVISTIALPEADDPDGTGPGRPVAAGFNLDNLDSGDGSTAGDADCQEFNQDFLGLHDAGLVGVDNALQGLVGTIEGLLTASDCPGMTTAGCLDATLQEQINMGTVLLILEVQNVNDFMFDSAINLQFFVGSFPGGMPMTGGDGTLAPGQTYTGMAVGAPVAGDIFAGRLSASTPLLTLMINAGGFDLPLLIREAEVRFDISETGLTNGVIGGFLLVDDLVTAAEMFMGGLGMTVRSIVGAIADVGPDPTTPSTCDSLSVGITFAGTTATRM